MGDKPFLRVGNYNWGFDVDNLSKYVRVIPKDEDAEVNIDVAKYEMMKMMIDVVMSVNQDDFDDKLGLSKIDDIPFKIAFNTLLDKNIITPK